MKFVLIYGAPATGKLTTALEFSKLSGYKLLHNHLIVDLVQAVAGENRTEGFYKLYETVNTDVIRYAVSSNVDLVSTFVYGPGVDDEYLSNLSKVISSGGGKLYFVQLICKNEELLKRVVNPSREKYEKIRDPEKLKKLLQEHDFNIPFADSNTVTIDNTYKTPEEVAKEISLFVNS